ncbi:MAG: RNA polymerase sigma factor [candidate division Zixibacteria bacterium]|nr:RNA polymerase sigma factor [candidate division Zixibacteria bacterium]
MRKNGYMKDDDAVLMHQLKRGRVKALSGLVEKYKKQAYYLALGMVGNSDDAFDISQEAFLRVYQSARTFDDKQPFFPWFYAIVANLCRNLLKKRQTVDNRQVDIDDVGHLLAGSATPETELLEREDKRKLFRAMRKLAFADREIINLNHFRMMSYDEIASVLDIPKGTVMSRLYYARRRLAELMEEDERHAMRRD